MADYTLSRCVRFPPRLLLAAELGQRRGTRRTRGPITIRSRIICGITKTRAAWLVRARFRLLFLTVLDGWWSNRRIAFKRRYPAITESDEVGKDRVRFRSCGSRPRWASRSRARWWWWVAVRSALVWAWDGSGSASRARPGCASAGYGMWGAQHGLVAAGVDESVAGRTRQRVLGGGQLRALARASATCGGAADSPTHPPRGRNAEPGARNAESELVLLPRTFICGG